MLGSPGQPWHVEVMQVALSDPVPQAEHRELIGFCWTSPPGQG